MVVKQNKVIINLAELKMDGENKSNKKYHVINGKIAIPAVIGSNCACEAIIPESMYVTPKIRLSDSDLLNNVQSLYMP